MTDAMCMSLRPLLRVKDDRQLAIVGASTSENGRALSITIKSPVLAFASKGSGAGEDLLFDRLHPGIYEPSESVAAEFRSATHPCRSSLLLSAFPIRANFVIAHHPELSKVSIALAGECNHGIMSGREILRWLHDRCLRGIYTM